MSTRAARGGLTSALRVGQRAATLAALAVAGAILLGYQIVAQRQALSDDINVQAAIIADNIAASLMFHDRDAATEMLRSFRPAPFLDAAAVYGADGQLFAAYHGAARHHGLLAPELTVEHRVAYRGSELGKVVLTADTAGVRNGVLRYAGLLALAALGALLATRAVSRRTHERVEQAERELAYLAYTDPVTDLPNRRASYERLEQELAACDAGPGRVGLLLIDLDNFKVVNDTAGHAAGDQLLCQVAAVLRATARASDLVGRIGGDEFVVVATPLAGRAELAALADRIVEALRAPLQLAGVEVRATASVGACMFPDDGTDMTDLLCNADAALYHAKGCGKDRIAQFRREMIMATQRRAQIERDLRRAIDDDALDVHYQPQYKCTDGKLVGVEALLRWTHPEHGSVAPAEFIPVAEQSGLIVDLGKWVLRRACRDAAALHADTGMALSMAVNVSARQLREKDFVQFVRDTLEASALAAGRLELELTESMLMEDTGAAIEFMEAVRALGVRLSIDDFGTGYSSLAYLQSFPLNHLKIDRSFVRQLPEAGGAIASAVIALAHRFNLTVVAEGVEQPAQLEWLRAAGCDFVQGYLTGRPMPLDALREQLLGAAAPWTESPAAQPAG